MPEPKTKMIAGETFTISQPYTEGHILTAIEARVLNQVRSENIGNNMRSIVKDALEKKAAGDSTEYDKLVEAMTKYDGEYSFAMPGEGGIRRTLDPIEREARNIAVELVRADLTKKGRKWKTVPEGLTEEQWIAKRDAAVDNLSTREDVVKLAKKRVAEKAKIADGGELDLS